MLFVNSLLEKNLKIKRNLNKINCKSFSVANLKIYANCILKALIWDFRQFSQRTVITIWDYESQCIWAESGLPLKKTEYFSK